MAKVTLNAYSKPYPFIVNRIRAAVYNQNDPMAIVASIIDITPGHPERTWHFPDLERTNYSFSLDEIDVNGLPVRNLAKFDVVPGGSISELNRADEQIQVGSTFGFNPGANAFVFDGTEETPGDAFTKKPDYIGWDIVPSELTGRGILVEGLDYSWNPTTGTLVMLQPLDVFQDGNFWNIHFNPKLGQDNSTSSNNDLQIVRIEIDTPLDTTHFGKILIVDPTATFLTVSLPNIATVPQGRRLFVEIDSEDDCCVNFIPYNADTINFVRGKIYACKKESFVIYKYTRAVGVHEWRVTQVDGNFKNVGMIVAEDFLTDDLFNKIPLDGRVLDIFQYARLYNEVVLNLPLIQRVNYDDWATGANKYLYSLANSANPANNNKFRVPDRRGLFERNNSTGKAGDYFADQVKALETETILFKQGASDDNEQGRSYGYLRAPDANGGSNYGTVPIKFTITGGTETHPKHYLINKYVLI